MSHTILVTLVIASVLTAQLAASSSDSNGEKWVDPHSEEAFFKADLLRDDWVDPTNPTVEFFNNKYEAAGGAREFVDPTDMGMPSSYSKPLSEEATEGRGTQTDEKQLNSSMETPKEAGECLKEVSRLKTLLAHQELTKQENIKSCPTTLSHDLNKVFLTRLANILVNSLGLEDVTGVLDTNAKIRMSSSEVKAVLDFASGASKHPADFDSAVSRMISHTFPDVEVPLWDRFLPSLPDEDIALRATLVLCLIYWLYMYFQGQYFRMLTSSFALSVLWHWSHLYKKAVSEKMTKMSKTMNVPKECSPADSMTWSEYFAATFTSSDKCREYHEAVLINPIIEVSPTMAVAETVTSFFLLPLEHIGRHLGKFFSALTGELTWFNSPFVLAFVFIALLLLAMMAFRYRIDLPFWVGSFGPSQTPQRAAVTAELRQELSALRGKVAALTMENKTLQQHELSLKLQREETEEVSVQKEKVLFRTSELNQTTQENGTDEVTALKEKVLALTSELNQTRQYEVHEAQEAQKLLCLKQQEEGTDKPTVLKKKASVLKTEHSQTSQYVPHKAQETQHLSFKQPAKGTEEVTAMKEKVLVASSEINHVHQDEGTAVVTVLKKQNLEVSELNQTHQDENNKVQEAQQQLSLNQQEVGTDKLTVLKKKAPVLESEHNQTSQYETHKAQETQHLSIKQPDKGTEEVTVMKEKVLVASSEINQIPQDEGTAVVTVLKKQNLEVSELNQTHQDETNKDQEAQQLSLNQQEVGTGEDPPQEEKVLALTSELNQMHQVEIHKTQDKQQQSILKQQKEGTDKEKEREGLATEDN